MSWQLAFTAIGGFCLGYLMACDDLWIARVLAVFALVAFACAAVA